MSLGTSGTAYAVMEERAVDPTGTVAGFADASGALPAADRDPQRHPRDRPSGRLARPRPRGGGPAHGRGRAALPRRRADAEPAARGRNDRRPATHDDPRGDPARRLRGRGRLARGGARPARRAGFGARSRRAAPARGRRRPGQGLAARRGPTLRPPVEVPAAEELVALGAAAQAAACLSGEPPEEVARRWGTRAGITVEPPAERDVETLARIRSAREATLRLHEPGFLTALLRGCRGSWSTSSTGGAHAPPREATHGELPDQATERRPSAQPRAPRGRGRDPAPVRRAVAVDGGRAEAFGAGRPDPLRLPGEPERHLLGHGRRRSEVRRLGPRGSCG